MTPKVDTFEHDIADEIRRKEATLEEVKAAAVKTAEQAPIVVPPKKTPIFTITLIVLLVISALGIAGVAYYYFHDSLFPPSAQSVTISKNDIPKTTADLIKISPTLGNEIGRYVTLVEKRDRGYILSINDYSSVFAYMTRNENAYIEELTKLFVTEEVSTSTPTKEQAQPVVATTSVSKTTVATTTPLATSTKNTATSTKITVPKVSAKKTSAVKSTTTIPTIPGEKVSTTTIDMTQMSAAPDSFFSDITVANQNMRVYKRGNHTVIYSFVGDKTVLISDSPEGILALKDAILH
jgi:hypothetical protein